MREGIGLKPEFLWTITKGMVYKKIEDDETKEVKNENTNNE